MKWKNLLIIIIIGIACGFAIFLIPEEEALPVAPVIIEYEEVVYETATVKEGDVVEIASLTCKYSATTVADLFFAEEGYEIQEILVSPGDFVEVGTLIGQLNMEDLEAQLASYEATIAQLELEMKQVKEKYNLAYNQQVAYLETLGEEAVALAQTPEEKAATYMDQIEELEDELWIESLRVEEVNEKILQRQIYSTISGTVTYVKTLEEGEVSNKISKIVSIIDEESCVFKVTSSYEDLFELGETTEIEVEDEYYSVFVAEIDTENAQKGSYVYYFQLENPTMELADGDYGKLQVVLEEQLDVLYLPENAIRQSKGEDVVYYINEDGIRDIKYVEVGLSANDMVEIISGLELGDTVIIG